MDKAMLEEESLKVLACLAETSHRRRPRPHQVPHGLMGGVRHPDRRQLAGAVQLGQHYRVPAVRLDSVARFHRNERWRDDDTVVAAADEKPVQAVPARTRFIAEAQPPPRLRKQRRSSP